MNIHLVCSCSLSVAIMACAAAAQAQTAPPIKPGLWQVQMEREVDGRKMPDMSERLKDMPPESRQRMEAMMKQRGVDTGGGGSGRMKLCLARESLDQGQWQGQQKRCKTDVTARSSSRWKWHSSCSQPVSETDGEALFSNPESYTVKSTTTMTMQGKTRVSAMTLRAQWLGADCGDLKPVMPPKDVK